MKRPALFMAAALATGILAASWLRPHPALALAALVVAGLWAAWGRRGAAVALLLTVAMAGALRYAYAMTAGRGDLIAWQGQKVSLVATVVTEPELRQPWGISYLLNVEQVNGRPARGKLYLTQSTDTAPNFGDRVSVAGVLREPLGAKRPGGYDQAAYLKQQGVYATLETGTVTTLGRGGMSPLRRMAVSWRNSMIASLNRLLPPQEAGLMAGLLLGSRSDLSDDVKEAFRASGVFHLLAVSGAHLALVVGPLRFLLRRWVGLSRRLSAAVAIPAVLLFMLLTGAGPSVLRAGAMVTLLLLGDVLRRERDSANTLGAAAFVLLLANPSLLFDVGFQLSAVATLGILLFARPIEGWLTPWLKAFVGERAGKWLATGLSVTLAAQLMVEPISLHVFGALSTIAPLTNLLVAVFLAYVVIGGWLAIIFAGVKLLALARLLGWAVKWGATLLLIVVKTNAAVPGAYLAVGNLATGWVVAWYGALALLVSPGLREALLGLVGRLRDWWRESQLGGRERAAACALLVLLTIFTWRMALAAPADTLYLSVIDVGQGDAILIEAPGGHAMLIDAGPAAPPDPARKITGYDAGATAVLPYLKSRGIKRLEYVVLSHPHQDHAGGMPSVLAAITVGTFLDTQLPYDAKGYRDTLALIASRGVPVRRPVAGEVITLGPSVSLEVLNPPPKPLHGTRSDENSNSIVFRLRYRQVSMLLAADMEAVVEERLLAEGIPLQADLLKVAHHGSRYSSTPAFVEAVHPRLALISLGNGNLFGHPDQGTVQRLRAVGATVYRTDRNGTLLVKTNGQSLSVTTAKGEPMGEGARPLGILGRRIIFAW